ncbi:MAG: insulinase family protein [Planctomycetaceae bacterium]|nr:insulinase family protein [Planctomycetaceae bacterium]
MKGEMADSYRLKNGMVLLGERMEVQSVSFQFLLPAGAALLPRGRAGSAYVISDWMFRGAGGRTSRQLVEAIDSLGIHHSESVHTYQLALSASLEAGNLARALELFADVILRPAFDPLQFVPSLQLAINDLKGLDDDPRQKVMMRLAEQFYPDPLGRPVMGTMEELESLTAETAAAIAARFYDPSQIIFSIGGSYDFDTVCRQMERLFENPGTPGIKDIQPAPTGSRYTHDQNEGAQVHIGLMTPVPPIASDVYYELLAAVAILSGSMSSRLFTEVREKRGLCYAVGAKYRSLKEHAGISCYAGTTPDKAQETLDVTIDQFRKLRLGISEDELQRAKVGLKTSLIMQTESTGARAGGIAADYFLLGHVREPEEIREKIEALSVPRVLEVLNRYPFEEFTVVTIGPRQVNV